MIAIADIRPGQPRSSLIRPPRGPPNEISVGFTITSLGRLQRGAQHMLRPCSAPARHPHCCPSPRSDSCGLQSPPVSCRVVSCRVVWWAWRRGATRELLNPVASITALTLCSVAYRPLVERSQHGREKAHPVRGDPVMSVRRTEPSNPQALPLPLDDGGGMPARGCAPGGSFAYEAPPLRVARGAARS